MDYLQDIFNAVHPNQIGFGEIFSAVLACLLLVASGFASGSEIAFFSLSPTDLNELDEEKNKADGYIKRLRNDSERTLATILITNNLVNVTIIMLCNFFMASLFDFGAAKWLEFLVVTIVLTFLLCIGYLSRVCTNDLFAGQTVLSFGIHPHPFWCTGREGGAEREPRAQCGRFGTGTGTD